MSLFSNQIKQNLNLLKIVFNGFNKKSIYLVYITQKPLNYIVTKNFYQLDLSNQYQNYINSFLHETNAIPNNKYLMMIFQFC